MPLPPLTDDAGWLRRTARNLRAMPLTAAGFGTLIAFNGGQIASLLVKPFSRRTFRRINRWCADTWWGWCVIAAERFNGTRMIYTGEDLPAYFGQAAARGLGQPDWRALRVKEVEV